MMSIYSLSTMVCAPYRIYILYVGLFRVHILIPKEGVHRFRRYSLKKTIFFTNPYHIKVNSVQNLVSEIERLPSSVQLLARW